MMTKEKGLSAELKSFPLSDSYEQVKVKNKGALRG